MNMTPMEIFGLLTGSYFVFLFMRWFGNYVMKTLKGPLDVKKLGEWAIVTGATDGIGKAYAFAMAKKGE